MVLFVAAALLLVFAASDWYVDRVSLPRYCQQQQSVLLRLAEIVSADSAFGAATRHDYLLAAKLAFLVPRDSDEPQAAYLERVRRRLQEQCK